MRVGILMRDTEYRDALTGIISDTGRDILVEISGESSLHKESVILTDVMPDEIEPVSLRKIQDRTLFLSPVPAAEGERSTSDSDTRTVYHMVFKYSDINTILSELSAVYSEWSGDHGFVSPSTRVFALISESDQLGSSRCRDLAAQIIYINGGSVLVIPLGYINDYRHSASSGAGPFRRLMYMVDDGKDYSADSFTVTDTYGISYLMLPKGINPVAGLDIDYLSRLIRSCGGHFDTVILDIGTCFRRENLELVNNADHIVFAGSGSRIGDLSEYIGKHNSDRAKRISQDGGGNESLEIDEYVREIYGKTDQAQHGS